MVDSDQPLDFLVSLERFVVDSVAAVFVVPTADVAVFAVSVAAG